MGARVIAVTGGKGGVGKSTTTINLAVSLRMDGYAVVIVDTDLEMPNIVEMLGIEPTKTIHDVLTNRATTEEAIVELDDGFGVVPGDPTLAGFAGVDAGKLRSVVETLRETFDVVLLDTGAGLSYDDVMPLGLADEVLLVTSPDAAAVQNASRSEAFVRKLGQPLTGIVVTNATGPVEGTVSETFDAEIIAVVPQDSAVRESTAQGKPLEVFAPETEAAAAYRRLEAVLTDGNLPPSNAGREHGGNQGGSVEDSSSDPDDDEDTAEPATAEASTDETEGETTGADADPGAGGVDEEAGDGLLSRVKQRFIV